MSAAEDILNTLADLLADRVADRLRAQRAPVEYTQDAPPAGMKKRTYLEHCYRADWPSRKVGRLRVSLASDVNAWRDRHPVRSARREEPVEVIDDEHDYVVSGGKKGKR